MKKWISHALYTSPVLYVLAFQMIAISLANELSKIAFTQIEPLYVSWWRVALTAIIMMAWRRPLSRKKRAQLPKDAKTWIILAALGVAVAGMNGVFYIAIKTLNSGVAMAIEFIGPLAVAVFTGKTWREYLGAALAFVGLLTLAGGAIFGIGPSSIPGLIAIICSGIMWGIYIVLGRMVAHGSSGLDNLTISLTLGWIIQSFVLAVPAIRGVMNPAPYATWARGNHGWLKLIVLMIVITLGASIVSYVLDQVLMRRMTANRFSVMQSLLPAVNLFVSLLFGSRPGILDYLGVGIIVFAVVISFSSDNSPLPSHDLTSRHHARVVNDEGQSEEIDIEE
ncbi:threonine transporter RhtB [Alloscardovia theropitheci]|uniref:Threonine transporter RhtB n=1 Tax=Alloscardovia theropitheci TaxID=2496842 RepID=A0A4R0QYV4_9BIFI|nr:EamA family transporter [Alloscardovia theropitheci]TCD53706.1 threonine transporter RhtB [Alloscardovia theropitheci]